MSDHSTTSNDGDLYIVLLLQNHFSRIAVLFGQTTVEHALKTRPNIQQDNGGKRWQSDTPSLQELNTATELRPKVVRSNDPYGVSNERPDCHICRHELRVPGTGSPLNCWPHCLHESHVCTRQGTHALGRNIQAICDGLNMKGSAPPR